MRKGFRNLLVRQKAAETNGPQKCRTPGKSGRHRRAKRGKERDVNGPLRRKDRQSPARRLVPAINGTNP